MRIDGKNLDIHPYAYKNEEKEGQSTQPTPLSSGPEVHRQENRSNHEKIAEILKG